MPARTPDACDTELMEAMNRGDLEAIVALYEPDALLVQDVSGDALTGHAAIREYMQGALALGLRMTRETGVVRHGDLALIGGRWEATGTDPDGNPIVLSGNSREIVRRQPDGTWRFVIDDPWGGDRLLPPR